MAMLQCTNKFINSYLTNLRFVREYPSWATPKLFHLPSYGANYFFCQPLVFSCDSRPSSKETYVDRERCYMFGSCSGLLLLYMGCLFVVNPLTKRFRILDHSGSKLIPKIVGGDNLKWKDASYPEGNVACTERAMCVGFAVDPNRKRFKIVGILEMETMYGFEINDSGDSWRLSETTITTSTKSALTTRMKPVYLDNTLHWLRNDGSIIAFNPETEQAHFIPSLFHQEPDVKLLFAQDEKINSLTLISGTKETIRVYILVENHKWVLARRIKNVICMEKKELTDWKIVGCDGKRLLVWVKGLDSSPRTIHVYDMEAKSWGVLGSIPRWSSNFRDFYKFTPSLFGVEEDEQHQVIVASNDERISDLLKVMGLFDNTK